MFLSSEDNMENTEAVTQKGSVKKLFLKTSENSQENTCARVSFLLKLQAPPALLLRKTLAHVFL